MDAIKEMKCSLIRSVIHLHCSLVCLFCTACFAPAVHGTHSFAHALTLELVGQLNFVVQFLRWFKSLWRERERERERETERERQRERERLWNLTSYNGLQLSLTDWFSPAQLESFHRQRNQIHSSHCIIPSSFSTSIFPRHFGCKFVTMNSPKSTRVHLSISKNHDILNLVQKGKKKKEVCLQFNLALST